MKRIFCILLAVMFANIAHTQTIRHAEGVKSTGISVSLMNSGYAWQPRYGYYIHKRILVTGSVYFEKYSESTMNGTSFFVIPQIHYSVVNISNFLYLNLSGGFNVGIQNAKSTDFTPVDYTTGIKIGANAGVNAEVFIYKGFAINGGVEYITVPKWLFGGDKPKLKFGLVYNFKFF